ncbi:MAG: S-layer homology domain-containing protein [Clostridiales bacterium]|nr:S-layer homology domain-containing protein [Clostridiales bacterium]
MKNRLHICIALYLISCLLLPITAVDTGDLAETTYSETVPEQLALPFSDIADHWAEDTIIKWSDSGIVNGYPDGTFRPDDYITRAELAKIITLAFKLDGTTNSPLYDVDPNEWYYEYVRTAADYIPSYPLLIYGRTNGEDAIHDYEVKVRENFGYNMSFLPENTVLRYHAAETFVRLKAEHYEIETESKHFLDVQTDLMAIYKDEEFNYIPPNMRVVFDSEAKAFRYILNAYQLDIMKGDSEDPNENYFYPFGSLTRAEVLTILDRIITPEEISQSS